MDTRLDFQRLLEDMDKVIQAKQQELDDLDIRLESTRTQLSELEANELVKEAAKVQQDGEHGKQPEQAAIRRGSSSRSQHHSLIHQQRLVFEEQLEKFKDELAELESINQELVGENKSLTLRLNKSLRNNEDLQVKTSSLADKLEEALNANLELNLRLGLAESEIKTQEKLLRRTHDEDEVLMKAFSDKVDSLGQTLEEKDEEIKRLRLDNQFALESFAMKLGKTGDKKINLASQSDGTITTGFDEDMGKMNQDMKQQVIRLVDLYQEKNSQTEQLKRELLHATRDMEEKASLLESLNPDVSAGHRTIEKIETKDLLARYEMLEIELEAKDRQLQLYEFRNNQYETILPDMIAHLIQALLSSLKRGSSNDETVSIGKIEALLGGLEELANRLSNTKELLREIDKLRGVNCEKDSRIEELVRELNDLHENQTNKQLASSNGSKQEDTSRRKSVSFKLQTPHEPKTSTEACGSSDKLPSDECRQDKLQVQDTASTSEIKESDSLPVDHSQSPQARANQDNELEDQTQQVDQNNEDEKVTKEEIHTSPNENTLDRQKSTPTLTNSSTKPKTPNDHYLNNELSVTRARLKQLENENELLELAMREILLSLKWSDAQCSTLLIDCPSLERLCLLIEARFISQTNESPTGSGAIGGSSSSGILFQLVVLKSELDLLRGQNEELRSNAKAQFREHVDQLRLITSERPNSKVEEQVGTKVSQACQTENPPPSPNEIKCKNCSKLTELAKHLLQCIVRVETRLRVSDEIYSSQLVGLNQIIQILEKDLSNSERQLDESRRELNHQNERRFSADLRMKYMQDQLNFHMKFCAMTSFNTSPPRVGAENLQIYTTAKSGNGDSIESYTISQKTASHSTPSTDAKMKDPRLAISMLQSIIRCLQARIEYKDVRLKQLEQLQSTSVNCSLDQPEA